MKGIDLRIKQRRAGATVALGVFFVASLSWAQGQSLRTPARPGAKPLGTEQAMKTSLTMEAAQSLHRPDDFRKYAAGTFRFNSTYTVEESYALGVGFSVSRGTPDGGSTLLSDILLKLTQPMGEIGGGIAWTPSIALSAPTSRASREIDRLYTGIVTTQSFSKVIQIGSQDISFSYIPSLKKNFHHYNVNSFGSPNMEYLFSNTASLATQLGKATTLFGSYTYTRGWTYNQFPRQLYQSVFGAQHAINSALSLSASMATGGLTHKPNGSDSNISFFNQRDTTVTGGLTYVY